MPLPDYVVAHNHGSHKGCLLCIGLFLLLILTICLGSMIRGVQSKAILLIFFL